MRRGSRVLSTKKKTDNSGGENNKLLNAINTHKRPKQIETNYFTGWRKKNLMKIVCGDRRRRRRRC